MSLTDKNSKQFFQKIRNAFQFTRKPNSIDKLFNIIIRILLFQISLRIKLKSGPQSIPPREFLHGFRPEALFSCFTEKNFGGKFGHENNNKIIQPFITISSLPMI